MEIPKFAAFVPFFILVARIKMREFEKAQTNKLYLY